MKRSILAIAVLAAALAGSARADFVQTYSTGFQNGGVIPDGSLVGWSDTRAVSGVGGPITDVNVSLNLSGGWNGDLYAYLVHSSGFAVLLNRVGRSGTSGAGYGDAGMNVTLDDQATRTMDIHWYQAEPGYVAADITGGAIWSPDGRNVDPLTGNTTTASRDALLGSFNGLDANGNWTLYIADVAGGDQATLSSWTLEIAAVPEPGSMVEGAVAVLFLGGVVGLYRLKGTKVRLEPC
jgi:subtilisin-like proprotein convertase family protein